MKYDLIMKELEQQISEGLIQGAVLQSNRDDAPICAGMQTKTLPMTANSRFDIASVGKTFTATCCAILVARGKLDPDAPFTEYIPEYYQGKDCKILVRDLATHSSGFDNSKPYHCMKPGPFEEKLFQLQPAWERRTRFHYSCANFIFLGKIAERIMGKDLDAVARELIWAPLGMNDTTWYPPGDGPNEVLHHDPTRTPGEHNDNDCFCYEKPLGNGRCFTTVPDLLKFTKALLGKTFFPKKVYDLIYTPDFDCEPPADSDAFTFGGTTRSFGWDMATYKRSNVFSKETITHSGYTGQSILVDPVNDFCSVILTSRIGNHDIAAERRLRLAEALFAANSK